MKRFHLLFGLAIVIAFLLTGQYMDKYYHHLAGMPDGPRMLYRTRHIFILLSGLLNLVMGAYFVFADSLWPRIYQGLGSGLIIVASFLFVTAFFVEPTFKDLHTPLSHWGTYLIVAGVICHLIGAGNQGRVRDHQSTKN